MRYVKDHWHHLLTSAAGGVFALGFAWAALGNRVGNSERRIDEIDRSRVQQTRWQVEQNTADLMAAKSDARQTQSTLARIDTRLGVIDAKLDALTEAVRLRMKNPDAVAQIPE